MLLPQHFTIEIDPLKLSGYLLNLLHPAGWGKAKYFHEHGITSEAVLRTLLLRIVNENEVTATQPNDFGIKYVVDGADENTQIKLRTVWVVLTVENVCKFVTAYPL
jgi:hypothetical protein